MTAARFRSIMRALSRRAGGGALAAAMIVGVLATAPPAAADEQIERGQAIYMQSCASCHGDAGDGVRGKYSKPLTGDMSRGRLANYIDRWMPEEDPELVSGEDAQLVARYVYDTFYSPIAQARNEEARIELSRLTGKQYRNAAADLIGSFREPVRIGEERGLRGRYFNARRPRGDSVADRVDERINLEFVGGEDVAEGLDTRGFAARWQGSIIAPETGTYEFILKSNHAMKLWVNSLDEPLIDAWVVSHNEDEYRASIFLIGGRAYPLRLDFTSFDQGVQKDDPDAPPVEGYLHLKWERPDHVAEVIDTRYLSPERGREEFVLTTPFPAEDRSVGYEVATSVSRAWHRATTGASIEAAAYVREHLDDFIGRDDDDREERARQFATQFVERAFRRPLDEPHRELFVDRQFEEAEDLRTAITRVVLLTLQSPRFLYLDFGREEPDSYDIATRLAFSLWDSLPDEALRGAAASDELRSPEAVIEHARRMVDDPRTRYKARQFYHHWLHLEHNPDADKAAELYPEFDEQLVSDLRTSLDLFLDEVTWGEEPSYRRLMEADELYVNGRLAEYYGFDLPADAPFQKVEADYPQRRGVAAHPYVLSVFAYHDTTSPIHRGVILARGMLGRTLRPPPEAFTPEPAEDHPDLTTRERVAMQTEPAACMSCHELINPLGFTLEQFDAVGRYREEENGKPVDSSGAYELSTGDWISFEDARDLAEFLAGSDEAHEAFVLQMFHHLVKQPIRGYGQEKPAEMAGVFAAHDFNIRRLMADIAATAALEGVSGVDLAALSVASADGGEDAPVDAPAPADAPTEPEAEKDAAALAGRDDDR